MAKQIFVGSLAFSVDDAQLSDFFATVGTVTSAKVILDRDNGNRSKGFGFVEMSSDEEADAAVAQLDGKELAGRPVVVNIARPREERPRREFGGNGGGRGGFGGNRGGNGGSDNFRSNRY
jgi:cold-inducible RNA-binding protein